MNYEEWDAGLRAKYPDMFDKRCSNEAPSGWRNIINDMCERLSTIEGVPPIVQIKEKFGGLRVYFDTIEPTDAEVIVANAERACEQTCDICGQAGKMLVSRHVWKVVCSDHENFMG